MKAAEYCDWVEQQDRIRKHQCRGIPVVEDEAPLVSLEGTRCSLMFEPSIVEDYAYLVRAAVFDKVERIGARLEKEDKVLIIRSAWRSFAHQRLIWDNRIVALRREHPEIHETELRRMAAYFIAPETKSMHVTGGALDALIFDVEANCVLDFGANDGLQITLGRRCYPDHPDISAQAKKNRELLIGLFDDEGFVCDLKEFWHFDYGNVSWASVKGEPHAIYGAFEAR